MCQCEAQMIAKGGQRKVSLAFIGTRWINRTNEYTRYKPEPSCTRHLNGKVNPKQMPGSADTAVKSPGFVVDEQFRLVLTAQVRCYPLQQDPRLALSAAGFRLGRH